MRIEMGDVDAGSIGCLDLRAQLRLDRIGMGEPPGRGDVGMEIAEFVDEGGPVRDALWCCDLTTSPTGAAVSATDRLDEIVKRYGCHHVVSQFVDLARPELLAAVERTQQRLLLAAQST